MSRHSAGPLLREIVRDIERVGGTVQRRGHQFIIKGPSGVAHIPLHLSLEQPRLRGAVVMQLRRIGIDMHALADKEGRGWAR